MTSMCSESATSILVSCKQTRFNVEASPNYRELDIEGLNIAVTSGPSSDASGVKGKAKAKAKEKSLEVLSDAKLRLKAGRRYALIGRNGTGKSTLLRAIADKLIPGIPEKTRISILQQTNVLNDGAETPTSESENGPQKVRTVLEEVIERATAKDELERDIETLSSGIDSSDACAALRSLRQVQHRRLQKQLFVRDKDARLRSGTRGMAARKALIAFEKTVAESEAKLGEKEDEISPEALQAETQEAADMLAELQLEAEPARLAEIESRAIKILSGLGFSDTAIRDPKKPISSLSGGWRMRAALAAALLADTDILILDEPTNFLDLLGIIWLQRYLLRHVPADAGPTDDDGPPPEGPTLILVSHDRAFTTAVCTDLLLLKDKSLTYHHGTIAAYEAARSERIIHMTKRREAQDKQKAHMQETISRNLREGRKGGDDTRVRQAKMRQKKLDERWGVEVSAKGTRFKLNRDLPGYHLTNRAELVVEEEERGVSIGLPEPTELRFPGPLVSLEKAGFRYAPATGPTGRPLKAQPPMVLEDITLSVGMGDRVGIVGLNGAGKTTLVKLLVEETRPTAGTLATHPRLRLGYYSQHAVEELQALGKESMANPDPSAGGPGVTTALSLLLADADGGLDEGEVRGLLSSLGLRGRTASDVPLARLSGGQLVRCALARVIWKRPQCLVLDEVTTHLDYETATALREALRSWEGAVVVVSHDRWFVRGVVEGIVDDEREDDEVDDSEGEEEEMLRRRAVYRLKAGKMIKLEGGVSDFEAVMEKRVAKLMSG